MRYGNSKYLPFFTLCVDAFCLNLALVFTFSFTPFSVFYDSGQALSIIWNLTWLTLAFITGNFLFPRPLSLSHNVGRLLTSTIFQFLIVTCVLYFLKLYDISWYIPLFASITFFVIMIVERSILFFILDFARKRGYNQRRILLLGDERIATRIKRSFRFHPEYGYKVTAFLPREGMQNYTKDQILSMFKEQDVHELYLCYKEINDNYLDELLDWFKDTDVKIKVVTDLAIDPLRTRLLKFYDFPVLSLLSKPTEDLKIRFLKRSFDLMFSSTVMLLGAPVFIFLILGTWGSSPGPIFYTQVRTGRNGRLFRIIKFRSMYIDAEKLGPQLAREDDPRVTPWGKFIRKTRLDELPQFFNVFMGDMSVVGPRPERQFFIEQLILKAPSYKKLLEVKPGITSLGQIRYGYAENVDQMVQRMRFDLLYLNNRRLRLDLRIIAGTLRVMALGKGK